MASLNAVASVEVTEPANQELKESKAKPVTTRDNIPAKVSAASEASSSKKAPSQKSSFFRASIPSLEASDDFLAIVAAFEEQFHIPHGLLLAIATVESMRRALAVHNFRGSRYFSSLPEAVAYVHDHEKTCNRSISIGYMQINWHVHKDKFSNLQEAFSPYHNVRAAVEILLNLYRRHGSWEKAIGWYNPKGGKWNGAYFQKVRRNWMYTATPPASLS